MKLWHVITQPCPNFRDGLCRIFHHDDVIKWKHFPRYWPFVRGIHRSPVNYPHKGQWRGALTFSLVCTRINGWINNREAGDLRRYRGHYDVTVMLLIHAVSPTEDRECVEGFIFIKPSRKTASWYTTQSWYNNMVSNYASYTICSSVLYNDYINPTPDERVCHVLTRDVA